MHNLTSPEEWHPAISSLFELSGELKNQHPGQQSLTSDEVCLKTSHLFCVSVHANSVPAHCGPSLVV